jgi:predicted ribosomally synthesized peptide with SipW-like signal peptide
MKKRTRLIIAGILAIAVTGASTFAYFTSIATVTPNDGQVPLALNITNGTVTVNAGIGDGSTTPTWTYDVARLSTSDATYALYGLTDTNTNGKIDEGDTDYNTKYVIPNRSKDIVGVSAVGIGTVDPETGRYAAGAPLTTGTISNARPGDALVLGVAGAGTEGINITNASNLTVKVKIAAKTDATTTNTINALATAGWVLFVNGNATPVTDVASLQSALDATTNSLAAGQSLASPIKIRLELPLLTTDAYEGKVLDVDTVTAGTQALDISSLFTIIATQENNPGWTDAGVTP